MTDPVASMPVSRARRAWQAAFGVPLAVLIALWALDGALLAARGLVAETLRQALVMTFPIVVAVGVVAGLLAAGLCALAWLDVDPARPTLSTRIVTWLRDGDPPAHAARIARSVAVLLVSVIGGYVAYRLTYGVVIDMAQPHYIALTVLAVHVVVFALSFGLVVPVDNGVRVVVLRLQRVSLLRGLLGAVWRVLAVFAFSGVVAAVVLAVRFRFAVSYLPWESAAQVLVALALGLSLRRVVVRLPRAARLLTLAALVAGFVTSVALANAWGERANAGRMAAEERTLTGAVGYRLLRASIDFDRDGHLHVLGGGDCAPHNAAIHPGATDLPENRIDEDCDGEDLTSRVVDNPAGFRFAVPTEWPERPPIVLITVDAFAATRMAAFGNTDRVTPRIDAFADSAAMFRACFAQGPSTRLSVPSMFTSRWDSQIAQRLEGKHPYPIDSSELTLAEVLRKAGYDTAAVLPDGYFDPAHWKGITDGFQVVDTSSFRRNRTPHNAQTVTDVAMAELAKPRKRPLFLWVHYYDAHSPHIQPEGSPRRGDQVSQIYDAELALVDREVGRLIDRLDQGPGARPMVVLTADHGIDFNPVHHAKFNYGYDLYTSVLHVPLVVRVPGAPRGRHEQLVSTMDIAPTIVNLLRLRDRFPFQGVSLVRELVGSYAGESRRLVHQFYIFENYWKDLDPLEKISLRTERFNLVHDRKRGAYELYDWKADYYEAQDLSADPGSFDVFKDLRKQLSFYEYSLHRRPAPVPGEPARRR